MAERRRRIALVTDAVGPFHRGGKELRYLELAPRLARGAEVEVHTMRWWPGGRVHRDGEVTYRAICPLVPLYRGRRRSIRQAVTFAVCCLRLLGARFDVIEADHMPYLQLLPLKLVALARRRRLVVTWHECWGPEYWREYLGPAGRIGWWCESLAMRLPDAIIAASPQTGARLRRLVGGRVPVIDAPNGIDRGRIERARSGLEPSDVVTVGRLLPHKRVDLLLDALGTLRDRGRSLTARIVGSGPERERLRERAHVLGLADRVEFRDDIDDAETLYAAVKSARAAVFPSEREGFGIAVLEALACGVPVIATTAPDNLARHLVARADGLGTLCEPTPEALADAIERALDDAPPAGQAPEWLSEYDWDEVAGRVAEVLA
ncbi:MAG TPA: glycosyltransferase family 4 protein [Solirubrobacteraceae bacterium]|nr:glycosyltransferase family 4 protein [Solirubrobacteraceae bacterium]